MNFDKLIVLNNVNVKQKIIPDTMKWSVSPNAQKAGVNIGDYYKANVKRSITRTITIHNTEDLNNIEDDAERYSLATYNQNMGLTRPWGYVDSSSVWQLLDDDEVCWCNGRGTYNEGAIDDLAIECVMGENKENDAIAEDKTARLVAYFLHKYNLDITSLRTHTYWINRNIGITGDVDYLNTYIHPKAHKKCPLYILPHWFEFKSKVQKYLYELNNPEIYYVRLLASKPQSQIGAFKNLDSAKEMADYNVNYRVYDKDLKKVYTPKFYISKYKTIKKTPVKFIPEKSADIIRWVNKNTILDVVVQSEKIASNGTVWVKIANLECKNNKDNNYLWIPLKYLKEIK